MDAIYIALYLAFFGLTWGFVSLTDRL